MPGYAMDDAGRAQRKGYPASRIPRDSHAFLHEDKFDTWLDLESHAKFLAEAQLHDKWETSWMAD